MRLPLHDRAQRAAACGCHNMGFAAHSTAEATALLGWTRRSLVRWRSCAGIAPQFLGASPRTRAHYSSAELDAIWHAHRAAQLSRILPIDG